MSGGHDSRSGLPATPREIAAALRLLTRMANVMVGDAALDPEDAAAMKQYGHLLLGMVAGFECIVYPYPVDQSAEVGYRVAQSLARGGTPWV